jgi:hypothetical protein
MAKTQSITTTQFEQLMENLCGYFCTGWGRNVNAQADEWDGLSFDYDGSKFLGTEFHLRHPFDKKTGCIDYNSITLSFSKRYPFRISYEFRITDPIQVARLTEAVKEPYRIYREKANSDTMPRSQRIVHQNGNYVHA